MDLFFIVLPHLCVVEILTQDEFAFFLPQLCHQYSSGNLLSCVWEQRGGLLGYSSCYKRSCAFEFGVKEEDHQSS